MDKHKSVHLGLPTGREDPAFPRMTSGAKNTGHWLWGRRCGPHLSKSPVLHCVTPGGGGITVYESPGWSWSLMDDVLATAAVAAGRGGGRIASSMCSELCTHRWPGHPSFSRRKHCSLSSQSRAGRGREPARRAPGMEVEVGQAVMWMAVPPYWSYWSPRLLSSSWEERDSHLL